ncbi:MAG: hypothetical protein JNJ63_12955 [Hyphomonadaceae bacterium]|nr:hypothetical protein [Hyphomonadaceae bacterium]
MRGLIAVGQARAANFLVRGAACVVSALVATSITGATSALYWLLGFAVVIVADREIFRRLAERCAAGQPPRSLHVLVAWTVFQSAYGNILAVLLWFSPYVPGETLAVIYLCGGLANAAATLRYSSPLAIAGAGCTVVFLLGLPIAEYFLNGAANVLDLVPLIGGLLLLAFGVNLWRSLLASDVAQAQAEAAVLRERQAAAAAAAAKSDMIKRMNDELRTPMAALAGAAEHLRRAATSPQARAHIATLAQAGEVLKLVLDDLSDLDRLENGKLPIEPGPCDPRDLLRSVVAAFRVAAQDKHLELFLDIAPDAPGSVSIDARRVRQVMFNLLANAVRYTTHGGVRVSLHAQRSEREHHARLTFSVADTGAGMSRSKLAILFGRERVTARGEGPGLGLSICLRLARLMGGQLHAKSELGEGSVFSLLLDAPVLAAAPRNAA